MGPIDKSILQSISALAETQILANPIISEASEYKYLQNQGNLLGGIDICFGMLDLWYKEQTWIPFSNKFSLFQLEEKRLLPGNILFPFKSLTQKRKYVNKKGVTF